MLYLVIKEFKKVKPLFLLFLLLISSFMLYFFIDFRDLLNSNSKKDIILQIIYIKNINFFNIPILNLFFGFFMGFISSFKEVQQNRIKIAYHLPVKNAIFFIILIPFLFLFFTLFFELLVFCIFFNLNFPFELSKILLYFWIFNIIFSLILFLMATSIIFSINNKICFIFNIFISIILVYIYFLINPEPRFQKAFYLNETFLFYEILIFIYAILNLKSILLGHKNGR